MNTATRRAYIKNDATLYNVLSTSFSSEALLFAMQNFGLSEETPEDSLPIVRCPRSEIFSADDARRRATIANEIDGSEV